MRAARLALVTLVALVGCAGTQVRSQATATDGLIATARDDGAQRCAPVELAMAESHNDYAEHALDEGNFYDAQHEAEVAEHNARLAIARSPKAKCNPPPAPSDRDHDGIVDKLDKCPDDPEDKDGFQDADGCPDLDNDADGIADKTDKCPNDPEDKDGFQDADGCPDPDNDGDGIADKDDKCPTDPEDKDGFQDADGCPDPDNDGDGFADKDDKCPNEKGVAPDGCPHYKLVVVTDKKIELKQTVYFDFNKATIRPVSYALLDDVAKALADHPKIQVEIQGHTDSVGNDDYNLKLSQKRAEAVKTYLVGKGIDESRMVPKGYGESVPIASNMTKAGRDQNRRVEFVITAQ